MKTSVRNPTSGIYPATDDYVHALEVRGAERLLFVSGTMGLDSEGNPGRTLEQQLVIIWSNIRTILASADMTLDNVVRLTSYLTDERYAETNASERLAALGGRATTTTPIVEQHRVNDGLVENKINPANTE